MNKKITYDTEPCLSENELLAYVQGNHDAAIERRVELHVADCELCSDALDGLQSTDNQEFIKENQDIKRDLKETYFPTKIVSIFSKRNVSIAASVSALIVGFWWWNQSNSNETIAQSEVKQNQNVAETKAKADSAKVSEKEIIAMVDDNISPKKSKVKKEKNAPILVLADENIGSSIATTSGATTVLVVPNPTTTTTGFSEPTITTTPSGEYKGADYTFDTEKAEKTPIKEEEKPKEDGIVKNNSNIGDDYKFYSDSNSVKNTEDTQKYVAVQNSYNPSKGKYPSIPATPTTAVPTRTDKDSKKKEQTTGKIAAKSKSNPKTNIEYSQADDKLLNEGIREYQKNRPRQAIEIFNRILAKNPENESAIFYKGASQAIDNQCSDAVNTLQLFNNSYPEGSAANSEATWLIANCQLKLMQKASAILLLKQLTEFYNPRQDDAKKLLEKL